MDKKSEDPVKEIFRLYFMQGFKLGMERGEKKANRIDERRVNFAFLRGLVIGSVLTFGFIAIAAAQTQSVPHAAKRYQRDLTQAARFVWGMEAPVASLAAQIQQESNWNPNAQSQAGARGLTQFIDATGRYISDRYDMPYSPFDPKWAMLAQSRYMKELHEQFEDKAANRCEAYAFAVASYNQGPGWTRRGIALSQTPTRWFNATEYINPGKSAANYRETFHYVRKILLINEPVYVRERWGLGRCETYARTSNSTDSPIRSFE